MASLQSNSTQTPLDRQPFRAHAHALAIKHHRRGMASLDLLASLGSLHIDTWVSYDVAYGHIALAMRPAPLNLYE